MESIRYRRSTPGAALWRGHVNDGPWPHLDRACCSSRDSQHISLHCLSDLGMEAGAIMVFLSHRHEICSSAIGLFIGGVNRCLVFSVRSPMIEQRNVAAQR